MPLDRRDAAGTRSDCVDHLSRLGMIDFKPSADATSTARAYFLACTNQEPSIPAPAKASYAA